MGKFSKGRYALMISDRSGAAFPYREMVQEWNGAWVHNSEYEPKQPQVSPRPHGADPQALAHAKPARTEFAVADLLKENPLETYQIGSPIVNVNLPGHGYTTGDTKRFRGPLGAAGVYGDPESVGGITGSTIAKAAGYTITVGKYVSGATDTDGPNGTGIYGTDWFYFSADTNATSVATGGGYPMSVGPVTLQK
jgi:hypothetical protein